MTVAVVSTRDTTAWPEFAGSTWVRLQYLKGLERLGIESYWVDHLRAIDPIKHPHSLRYLIDQFRRTAEDFGFEDRWSVVYNRGERHFGLSDQQVERLASSAELLIGVSGALAPESPLMRISRRAYVDVDPGFTQIWASEVDMGFGAATGFFTTGQNVGGPGFDIPLHRINWHPILPPVVLDLWPPQIDERHRWFSTVGDWRGSQQASFEGRHYGAKRDEFLRFLGLPEQSGQEILLALLMGQRDHEDLGLLDQHGWKIRDPAWFAGDPHAYREFIQRSRAEFSVAKHGYVASRSGWVSDRTACYLASGKPALVQSTGQEERLPTGKGLLTFSTVDEAVEAIADINRDYLVHCHAARELAERYFDSNVVLGSMLDVMGL